MSHKRTTFTGLFPHHDPARNTHNNNNNNNNKRPHDFDVNSKKMDLSTSQYEEDNVLMDPDWSMDTQDPVPMASYHQARGSFAALSGMSPCLGVPPVDCLFYPSNDSNDFSLDNNNKPARRRRRHFSLEDYQENLDESSSSNDSFNQFNLDSIKDGPLSDLCQTKSFMNDLSYASDLDHLEMGSDSISHSLRTEFELLMMNAIQNGNPANGETSVNFPPDLLAVIARHVLQEAADEPYGIKGCLLHIQYEGQTALHHLGTLDCDPEVAAKTFELTLTLRQAQSTWGQRMARRFSFSSSTSSLSVSTSYKLVKKRKYRV